MITQIQINTLAGELKTIEPQGDMEDKQMLIDFAVSKSGELGGCIAIIGSNLDQSPTLETAHIIARDGELIWQNVLDPVRTPE